MMGETPPGANNHDVMHLDDTYNLFYVIHNLFGFILNWKYRAQMCFLPKDIHKTRTHKHFKRFGSALQQASEKTCDKCPK